MIDMLFLIDRPSAQVCYRHPPGGPWWNNDKDVYSVKGDNTMKSNKKKSRRQLDELDVGMGFLGGFVLGSFVGIISAVINFL